MTQPLAPYQCMVLPEWVDYNGHLRDAYYTLIFSYATDALMDHIGLDAKGRARHRSTIYTLETHISYLHEVDANAAVSVHMQLIAHDLKRIHLHQVMTIEGRSEPVSVAEQLLVHVTTAGTPHVAPFTDEVMQRVDDLAAAHLRLRAPTHVGRSIRLYRSSSHTQPGGL